MSGLGRGLVAIAGAVVVLMASTAVANADAVTYTVEPWDFDGVRGINMSVTRLQLGGRLCPCVKVPYPADGLHNDAGVAALAATPLRPGDTVLGFSLGSQVISLYLARNKPPPGVRFVLLGDTFARNDQLVSWGQGVPADIANEVILAARQYDGWSDFPTNVFSLGYQLAMRNAQAGASTIHNYIDARLEDPANVVTKRGNITAVLIPTQHLPVNDWLRGIWLGSTADRLDATQRPLIDSAYNRPGPTPTQVTAAAAEQVVTGWVQSLAGNGIQ